MGDINNPNNPYGQNPYNQNSYGQNPYAQDPNNQNPYGQDPYSQGVNNQNQYDPNQYAQNQYDQGQYGQNSYGQDTYNQNPYAQNTGYNNSNPGMTYQNTGDGPDYDQPQQPYGDSSYGGSSAYGGGSTYGSTTYNRSSIDESNYNSGLGIASLVLSFLGCTYLIGLILGIIALVKKDGRKKTCAIFGVVIGALWLIVSIVTMASGKKIGEKIIEYTKHELDYNVTTESATEATTEYSFDFGNDDTTTESTDINWDDLPGSQTFSQPGFDADAIAKELNVKDYKNFTEYLNHYYLVIENPTDYVIDLDVSVNYYDDNDKIIGTDSYAQYAIDKGKKALFIFYPDDAFARAEYKINVKEPQWYLPATDDITYEVSETDEKVILTIKNTSDHDLNSVDVSALFFKDGKAVGSSTAFFIGSDYNFKAGEEISKELNNYGEFDDYELFIAPKVNNF